MLDSPQMPVRGERAQISSRELPGRLVPEMGPFMTMRGLSRREGIGLDTP